SRPKIKSPSKKFSTSSLSPGLRSPAALSAGKKDIRVAMKVRIQESLFIACRICPEARPQLPAHPKIQDNHHMYEVVEAECTGCDDCLPYCPVPGALEEYGPNHDDSWRPA